MRTIVLTLMAVIAGAVLVCSAMAAQTVGQPPERGQWKLHAESPNMPGSSLVVQLHGGVPVVSSLRVEFGDLPAEGCDALRNASVRVDRPIKVEKQRARRAGGLIELNYAVREPSAAASINGKPATVMLRIYFFNTGTRENGNVTTRMLSGTIEPQGSGAQCRAEFAGTAQRRGPE